MGEEQKSNGANTRPPFETFFFSPPPLDWSTSKAREKNNKAKRSSGRVARKKKGGGEGASRDADSLVVTRHVCGGFLLTVRRGGK